jgi:glutamate racemase
LTHTNPADKPIGIFDSGIGGLTVANAILAQLPNESICYFGDTAHIPYGTKQVPTIRQYCEQITTFLLTRSCKAIVVACNTATAAALPHLRAKWPDIPFIGMEPAVKPAVLASKSRKIGVLATQTTFKSPRYQNLLTRFAEGYTCFENPCIGLVERIEAGEWEHPAVHLLLQKIIEPMLESGVDTLVLGCTHYPFVQPTIASIAGRKVEIIDPAPAIARQLARVLAKHALSQLQPIVPKHEFWVSGNEDSMRRALTRTALGSDWEINRFKGEQR